MRRLLPLALVCLAASSAAADGFYFTEGVGGFRAKDEITPYVDSGVFVRISAGMRSKNVALEAWMAVAADDHDGLRAVPTPDGVPSRPTYAPTGLGMYGLDLKLMNPVARHVEVYLRGSMSAAEGTGALDGWNGRGLGVGAGVQLKGKVPALGFLWLPFFFTNIGPKVTGALWLDDGYDFFRLHGNRPTAIDAQLTHITLGFAIGSDF